MSRKKKIIISIIASIAILVIGIIFIVHKEMNTENTMIADFKFELDSDNKFEIVTDFRWMTMQNDGGSNTSIYYQIDLDNSIVKKVQKGYKANLAGIPETSKNIIYTKIIDEDIHKEIKELLKVVMIKEDTNEDSNFKFFTISSLNYEKNIYNTETIKSIKILLEKIDETEDEVAESKRLEEIKKANEEATAKHKEGTEEEKEKAEEELEKIEKELKEMAQNQVE